MSDTSSVLFKHRFRGFLPVVVDLETGGFNASTDGILEIAATFSLWMRQGNCPSVTPSRGMSIPSKVPILSLQRLSSRG